MKDEEFNIDEAEIDMLIKEYHTKPSRAVRDRLNYIIIEQSEKFYERQEEKSLTQELSKEQSKSRGREM